VPICKKCGHDVPTDLDGMYCSSLPLILICQGRDPIPACGKPLTPEERHWYGTTCEACERKWGARIEAWRKGGADTELDAMLEKPL